MSKNKYANIYMQYSLQGASSCTSLKWLRIVIAITAYPQQQAQLLRSIFNCTPTMRTIKLNQPDIQLTDRSPCDMQLLYAICANVSK